MVHTSMEWCVVLGQVLCNGSLEQLSMRSSIAVTCVTIELVWSTGLTAVSHSRARKVAVQCLLDMSTSAGSAVVHGP